MEQTRKNGVHKYTLLKSVFFKYPLTFTKEQIKQQKPTFKYCHIHLKTFGLFFFPDQFGIDYLLPNTHSKTELDQLESYKWRITIFKKQCNREENGHLLYFLIL